MVSTDRSRLQPGAEFGDRSRRIDDTGNPGIGAPYYPPAGLDGPQPGIILVLTIAWRITPPAIIGNDGDNIGAVVDIL